MTGIPPTDLNDEERGPIWIPLAFMILFLIMGAGAGYLVSHRPVQHPPMPRLEGDVLGAGVPIRICRTPAPTKYVALDPEHPCTPMAALYADPDMKVPLANPVYTDPLGRFDFYAEPGYYRFEVGTK